MFARYASAANHSRNTCDDDAASRQRVQLPDQFVNSTYFGLLAEFGEANIPLERVAPKYFGLSFEEARRRAPTKMLPCPAFRLGGQKSPWLVSAADLAALIDQRRERAAQEFRGLMGPERQSEPSRPQAN